MEYLKQTETHYWLRLEKGEKLAEQVRGFARNHGIPSGYLMGLGALCDVHLGYYDLEHRKYEEIRIAEDCELVNLTGNISWKESEVVLHAHVSLGLRDFRGMAGHLFEGTVAVTVELGLWTAPQKVMRKWNEPVGLFLQDFSS